MIVRFTEPLLQLLVVFLVQALLGFYMKYSAYKLPPIVFFIIPVMLFFIFNRGRFIELLDKLGFNTKNIFEKVLSGIVGLGLGISLFFIISQMTASIIPITSMFDISDLIVVLIGSFRIPVFIWFLALLSFVGFILLTIALVREKIPISLSIVIFLALFILFLMNITTASTVTYFLVGFFEELLSTIFLVCLLAHAGYKSLENINFFDLLFFMLLARVLWATLHVFSLWGFNIFTYIIGTLLGVAFMISGFIYRYDIAKYITAFLIGLGIALMILKGFYVGVILPVVSLIMLFSYEGDFREYVIYAPVMAHFIYDLLFLITI